MALCVTLSVGHTFAGAAVNVGHSACGGVYSFSESGETIISCTGDFSFADGTIFSDQKLTIFSGGSLSMDNLKIDAPEIWLYAHGDMTIGPDVALVAPTPANGESDTGLAKIYISAGGSLTATFNGGEGSLLPFPGDGDIEIGNGQVTMPSVPLPGTNFLLLSALLVCSALRPVRPQLAGEQQRRLG